MEEVIKSRFRRELASGLDVGRVVGETGSAHQVVRADANGMQDLIMSVIASGWSDADGRTQGGSIDRRAAMQWAQAIANIPRTALALARCLDLLSAIDDGKRPTAEYLTDILREGQYELTRIWGVDGVGLPTDRGYVAKRPNRPAGCPEPRLRQRRWQAIAEKRGIRLARTEDEPE